MAEQVVTLEVQGKPWWKSKIIWANLLGGAVELAQLFAGVGLLPIGAVSLAVNGVTIVLRHMTTQPLDSVMGNTEPQKIDAVLKPQPMRFVSIEPTEGKTDANT